MIKQKIYLFCFSDLIYFAVPREKAIFALHSKLAIIYEDIHCNRLL